MSNFSIRKIKPEDNIPLASIIRKVFTEYGAPKNGTVFSDPTTDKLYELFSNEKATLFVIEERNNLMGCCGIYPTKGLPKGCTEIVKFYLLAEGRGKGFGKALYNKCEKEAIKLGYNQFYIESIPEFKEAVGMYKKIGFKLLNKPLGNTGHFGCNIWFLKTI